MLYARHPVRSRRADVLDAVLLVGEAGPHAVPAVPATAPRRRNPDAARDLAPASSDRADAGQPGHRAGRPAPVRAHVTRGDALPHPDRSPRGRRGVPGHRARRTAGDHPRAVAAPSGLPPVRRGWRWPAPAGAGGIMTGAQRAAADRFAGVSVVRDGDGYVLGRRGAPDFVAVPEI